MLIEDGKAVEVSKKAMNVKTFMAYLELMERDAKRKKREEKKAKMQNKMKSGGDVGF